MKGQEIIAEYLSDNFTSHDVSDDYDTFLNKTYIPPTLKEPFKELIISEYLKQHQKTQYMLGFYDFVEDNYIEWNEEYWIKSDFDDAIDDLLDQYKLQKETLTDELNSIQLSIDEMDSSDDEELDQSEYISLNCNCTDIKKDIENVDKIIKYIKGEKI